jgi:hypothetical protein
MACGVQMIEPVRDRKSSRRGVATWKSSPAPGLPLGGLWRVTHGVLDSLFRRLYALVVGGAR